MNVLALEASTTSVKAIYYTNGTIKAQKLKEYVQNPQMGIFADVDDVFDALCLACSEMEIGEIDMISVGAAWHSLVVCNENMEAVAPEYSWQYTKAAPMVAKLREDSELTKKYYKETGCVPHSMFPAYKLKYLSEQGMDVKDKLFSDIGSYMRYKLTGVNFVSQCTASASAFLNINTLSYSKDILSMCGIKESQLGELSEYTRTDPLCDVAAKKMGIKAGIPVLLAFSDGGLNQIASCGTEYGKMSLSIGTSAAMRLNSKEPIVPDTPSTWCYYSPVSWMVGAATSGACNCVDWAKNSFFESSCSYKELDNAQVDAKNLPIFLPFLFSERCPGWNDMAQGGFFGVKPQHKPIDFYHAVLEGVLYNIRQCYDIITDMQGHPDKILLSGGITKSPVWMGMLCDILARDVHVDPVGQASLVGGIKMAHIISGNEYPQPEVVQIISPKSPQDYQPKYERYLEYYQMDKK